MAVSPSGRVGLLPEPRDETEEEAGRKRKAHGMLKLYYGLPGSGEEKDPLDPTDVDGAHFNPEVFLNKLRKECPLPQLMDCEADMVKQIRALDSDMQTLVYENYNKFISATDTIRKMKNDFKKMEDEMDCLATNMAVITEFSARISSTLQDQHEQITKLSGVHMLLRKLQFLFELPARLNKCIELEAYGQAVRYYGKARSILHQYQHMPSFQGIQNDCQKIMASLSQRLREKFRDGGSSAQALAECVELLLQLDEPAEELCDEFLSHARLRLEEDLAVLQADLGPPLPSTTGPAPPSDILEFIDRGCNGFVSSLCLVIASYQDLFISHPSQESPRSHSIAHMAQEKLVTFVNNLTSCYFSVVEQRLQLERGLGDNSLLVRALDRFHRRLQALVKLLPTSEVAVAGTEIVVRAAEERVRQYLQALCCFFLDCLTDVRQTLAAPRLAGKDSPSLAELLASVSASILNQIKSVLTYVHLFTAKDITFSNKPYFKGEFCSRGVREGLIVGFIKSICQTARQFCETAGDRGGSTPPALLLLLSRLCLDYETSTISYILTLTDEQFLVQDRSPVTAVTSLCSEAREAAQKLLNHYVKVQGLIVSQMLRKSVETRDWINTIEPRNVRAVMKRVVEDTTSIDVQVGLLYEEGVRKAHSSDSSKRAFSVYSSSRMQTRYAPSYTPSAPMDTNLLSNIQKLFSERIDIFSPVEFNKVQCCSGACSLSWVLLLQLQKTAVPPS
ncbi:vacuolar protein sorting-associated protein 51 homolog isoform X2 [Rhinatrema bivittatum]|uniref:vacuolar protein sorting-associated protein 51 homolog isoform X2 n=1 Tax=Rhinatrema bivittatum TaxID=194408 RepID=UPI001128F4B6|nr:vacuolar protein sorting-associated protein 51 homolog isoform X2 [Rhinatrema bivittatum]